MTLRFTGERMIPGCSPKRIEIDHLERYRFAAAFVAGKTVLDVACGVGYGSRLLADCGARLVTGIDVSMEAITHAREHYAAPGVMFDQGNLCGLSLSRRYDVITCFETIEHVKDLDQAMRALAASLAPGGRLFISSPNRLLTSPDACSPQTCRNKYHEREFTLEELTACLREHGFVVGAFSAFGQRFQPYWRSRSVRALYAALARPQVSASPVVAPVRDEVPRYFVLVATAS